MHIANDYDDVSSTNRKKKQNSEMEKCHVAPFRFLLSFIVVCSLSHDDLIQTQTEAYNSKNGVPISHINATATTSCTWHVQKHYKANMNAIRTYEIFQFVAWTNNLRNKERRKCNAKLVNVRRCAYNNNYNQTPWIMESILMTFVLLTNRKMNLKTENRNEWKCRIRRELFYIL